MPSADHHASLHCDVDAEDDAGTTSIEVGHEGLFVLSGNDEQKCEILRLQLRDAVYLTGRSRFAWHGVSDPHG